jgi:hypothetical protein
MATVMMMLILFMEDGCPYAGCPVWHVRAGTASIETWQTALQR